MCVGLWNSTSYALRDSLEKNLFIRVYHLSGTLGWTTTDNTAFSKKLKRHSFEHVGRADIDKMCGLAQNMHQWRMLDYAGVVPGSQEAYELLKKGLVKPLNSKTPPLIYGVRCIKFEPPEFTLEVHCVNETYTFLRDLFIKLECLCDLLHTVQRFDVSVTDQLGWNMHWWQKNGTYGKSVLAFNSATNCFFPQICPKAKRRKRRRRKIKFYPPQLLKKYNP